jgi:hypothetical protein
MYLAGQMFYYSIMNADEAVCEAFFKDVESEIKQRMETLLGDGHETYKTELHDKNYILPSLEKFTDPAFLTGIHCVDEWMPHNLKENQKYMYLALMQSVRLAGLMHDAGHPPFSHITESAMREVWREIQQIPDSDRSDGQKAYNSALSRYFTDGGELHETIGNNITDRLLQSILKPMPDERNADRLYLPSQLFDVMVKEMTGAILGEKRALFKSVHGIISGSLDADRLDYVTRDMMNSGLDVGKIEYDRLIPQMKLIKNEDIDPKIKYYFCPSIKSANVLEDFFNRRWNLYKKIILHHRVIKTDFLLRDVIVQLLRINLQNITAESAEMSADQKILPYDISGLWRAVGRNSSRDVFFKRLTQWNDGWLMVVLKKAYLEMEDNADEILKDKLTELLTGERHYYSILKNSEMFGEIEQKFIYTMKSSIGDVKAKLKELSELSEKTRKENEALRTEPFCNDLREMIRLIENYNDRTFREKGFVLGRVARLIFGNYYEDGEETFQTLVRDSVNQMKENHDIRDIIVEFKGIKPGIQDSLMLYRKVDQLKDNQLIPFKNISNTEINLKIQQEFVLPFYIYVNSDKKVDAKEIRIEIGKNIGESIVKQFVDFIENWIDVLKEEEDTQCVQ